jgi:uncharacterized membrane protein SirB2
MSASVREFSNWLAATPASAQIQDVGWIIPTVQTIHILSIAIVMSSMLLINLRVLGVISRTQGLDAVARRFLPWIWFTLIVLALSGGTLIVGEPGRSLQNPAFIAKMSMLAAVIVLTLSFQRGLHRDARFWEASRGRRVGGKMLAVLSLCLWVGIVFAGRWIAYIDVDAA